MSGLRLRASVGWLTVMALQTVARVGARRDRVALYAAIAVVFFHKRSTPVAVIGALLLLLAS